MVASLLKTLFLVSVGVATSAAQCPTGWTMLPDKRRCILATSSKVHGPYANSEAQRLCSSLFGGNLATIRDSADNAAFLAATKNGYGSDQFWIGLHVSATKYVWQDGTAATYTNWISGSVSQLGNCVSFSSVSGKWTAGVPCDTLLPLVCETLAGVCSSNGKNYVQLFESGGSVLRNALQEACDAQGCTGITTLKNKFNTAKSRIMTACSDVSLSAADKLTAVAGAVTAILDDPQVPEDLKSLTRQTAVPNFGSFQDLLDCATGKRTCSYKKFQVGKTSPVIFETEGAISGETFTDASCTKEIFIAPEVEINARLSVKIKAYVDSNAYIDIVDITTGQTITSFSKSQDGYERFDEEFDTSTRALRIESYASQNGSFGYTIEASFVFGTCSHPDSTLFDNGTRCITIRYPGSQSFSGIQYICQSLSGRLATVRSSSDHPAFNHAIRMDSPEQQWPYKYYWFGLYKDATSKYVWDDGSTLGYTNWKSGPSSSASDCAALESQTLKWVSGTPCTTPLDYICELPAMKECPYEELRIPQGSTITIATDGASLKKMATAYNCTKVVSVANPGMETVFVTIKYRIARTAHVDFFTVDTGREVKSYWYGAQWTEDKYDFKLSAVKVEVYSSYTSGSEIGCIITFESRPVAGGTTATLAPTPKAAPSTGSTAPCSDVLGPDGTTDCPQKAYLCTNALYWDYMTQQCPRTCNRCGAGTGTGTLCADRLGPNGVTDCPQKSYLCNNAIYYDYMTEQCPFTCNRC